MQLSKFKILFIYVLCFYSFAALASDEHIIVIKDHKFIPDKLHIPANKKVKLVIHNQDNEVEEFESFDLRREKIIPANGQIKLNIGPLEPGEYKIFGDFHSDTALGIIIVK
jgi:hypothetical protein